jgi:hypothetical protein
LEIIYRLMSDEPANIDTSTILIMLFLAMIYSTVTILSYCRVLPYLLKGCAKRRPKTTPSLVAEV